MAATSAASSPSPARNGHDAKQERARASRKAFEIRNRLRAGLPVSDADRAFAVAYDHDPSRRKIRRQFKDPPIPMPTASAPVAPPGTSPVPAPAQQPTPSETSAGSDGVGDLPPLRVDVSDLAADAPRAQAVDAARVAAEASAARAIAYARAMNAASHEAGALMSLPPELADLVFVPLQPCVAGFIARHGNYKLTEKQEDGVVIGTAIALVAGQVEARELRKKKAGAAPATASASQPEAQPAPAPVSAPPPERRTPAAEPEEYAGL